MCISSSKEKMITDKNRGLKPCRLPSLASSVASSGAFTYAVGLLHGRRVVGYLFGRVVGHLFGRVVGHLFGQFVGHLFGQFVGHLVGQFVGRRLPLAIPNENEKCES